MSAEPRKQPRSKRFNLIRDLVRQARHRWSVRLRERALLLASRAGECGRTLARRAIVSVLPLASRLNTRRWRAVFVVASMVLLVVTLGLCLEVRSDARTQPVYRADAIIVLGAGSYRGVPKRVYRARLDHAVDLYARGFAPRIIVTELSPTGEAAQAYLIRQGVPDSAIAVEDHSRTTWENLVYAHAIMCAHGWRSAIIVTCPFHLHRALRMAHDMGLSAQGGAALASPVEARSDRKVYFTVREAYCYLGYLCANR